LASSAQGIPDCDECYDEERGAALAHLAARPGSDRQGAGPDAQGAMGEEEVLTTHGRTKTPGGSGVLASGATCREARQRARQQ